MVFDCYTFKIERPDKEKKSNSNSELMSGCGSIGSDQDQKPKKVNAIERKANESWSSIPGEEWKK